MLVVLCGSFNHFITIISLPPYKHMTISYKKNPLHGEPEEDFISFFFKLQDFTGLFLVDSVSTFIKPSLTR